MKCVTWVCVWLRAGCRVFGRVGERIGLGFTNPGVTGENWDMCLCFGCDRVGGFRGSGGRLGSGYGRVGWR